MQPFKIQFERAVESRQHRPGKLVDDDSLSDLACTGRPTPVGTVGTVGSVGRAVLVRRDLPPYPDERSCRRPIDAVEVGEHGQAQRRGLRDRAGDPQGEQLLVGVRGPTGQRAQWVQAGQLEARCAARVTWVDRLAQPAQVAARQWPDRPDRNRAEQSQQHRTYRRAVPHPYPPPGCASG
jgi:hypothetical protein